MTERHKVLLAVYLVLMRDGKILLSRRANTGYMDGQFSLPSGHVENKEGALNAMIREAKEEIGLILSKENLQLAHTMHRNIEPDDRQGYEYIDLYFVCREWDGDPKNLEPEKCSELAWFGMNSLPVDIVPEVRDALLKISDDINYSEFKF
jgi:8-oxo-dGTP diphosphatase